MLSPLLRQLFVRLGSFDAGKAIDDIIEAAGPSLFQFNDASTYSSGSWPDSSGNGREMTPQSGAVAPGASKLNGRPAVQFGASNRLTSVAAAADYLPLINRAGRAVIYMVLDMDDSVGQDMYLFNMGSSGSGMWNGYVDVSSSERAFTLLRDNAGGVATNIGLGGIGVPTGIRNQFLKVSADTEADMVSVSSEGNTSRNPAALSGTAPASLASTLVIGGLNAGSLSFPMSGPVSAFIILLDPTEEQENAVEVVLRREYLKQESVLVDIVEAAGSSLYQFNDAGVYNEGTGDWLDTSVNGRDLSRVGSSIGTSVLNGRPAVDFEGSTHFDSNAPSSDYDLLANSAGNCRVYTIQALRNAGAFQAIWGTGSTSGFVRSLDRWDQNNNWHISVSGTATTQTLALGPTGIALENGLFKYTKKGASDLSAFYTLASGTNGQTSPFNLTDPVVSTPETLHVGAQNGSGIYRCQGLLSAVVILDNPTPEQEAAVEAVLRREYLKQDAIQSLGPAVYLRADTGITLNGSDVSAWADQSGWGNDVTQATPANQPLFSASVAALNGQPAVTNTLDSHVLDSGSYAQGKIPADAEHFIVGTKPAAAPASNAFVTSGVGVDRQDFFFLANGAPAFYGGGQLSGLVTAYDGSAYLANVRTGTGTDGILSFLDNSGEDLSTGNSGSLEMGKLRTGGLTTSGSALVDTAEIIIFPRKLSFTERDQVMKYLSGKYGIPYTTPLPYPAPVSNFLGADFDGTAIANTYDESDLLNLYGDQQGAVVTRKGHQALHLTGDTRIGGDNPGSSDGRYNWPGVGSNTISLAFVLEWQSDSPDTSRPAIWGTDQPTESILMGTDANPSQAVFRFGSTPLTVDLSVTQGDLVVFVVSITAGSFIAEFRNITTGASSQFNGLTNSATMATCWFNDITPNSIGFAPENYWFRWSIWDKALSDEDAATVADAYAEEFSPTGISWNDGEIWNDNDTWGE